MPGARPMASMGPTDAKVTPIITGSRMPTPGRPKLWISVARPPANRSALIRNATWSGGRASARPTMSGTATAPAYITSTCWTASGRSCAGGSRASTAAGFSGEETG